MNRILMTLTAIASLTACGELEEARDVSGNFEVTYSDNMRVYIGDELVAEITDGEDATVEYNGESFDISTLCEDEDTQCPSESWWAEVGVEQPWGAEYALLNFVNLDTEHGTPGQRMGGTMANDGSFAMLSGLAVGGEGACGAIGVGTVSGLFSEDNAEVLDGVVAYEWAGGCVVGEVVIGTSLRLESDYSAVRTGDLDLSSVTPEAPIDEDGEEIDEADPDEDYAVTRAR